MWKYGKIRPQLFFAAGPVFGADDRVSGGGGGGDGLPTELQGKSAAEVAAYYQTKIREMKPPDQPPPPGTTNTDFFNDPTAAANRLIQAKALTKEEFDRAASSMRPSMIWAAKKQCQEAHKDFDRIKDKIADIMSKVPEWQHTDPNMWETAYIYAKGAEHDRLATEDRVAPPSAEPVNPGLTPGAPLTDLSKVTLPGLRSDQTAAKICERLQVDHDRYRASQKTLDGDGMLPMTLDNRGKR